LREERGLVYSVYSYNAAYSDAGLFVIYAALNLSQLYDALALITEETRRLFSERVTKEQLLKTKEQMKSNMLLSLESSMSRMGSIGAAQLMLNRVATVDEVVRKIDAITMDDFYTVCKKIFVQDKVSLSLVGKGIGELDIKNLSGK